MGRGGQNLSRPSPRASACRGRRGNYAKRGKSPFAPLGHCTARFRRYLLWCMPDAPAPLRILTAVPVCDGHDSAVTTINIELARHGLEVIYLGYHQSASAIVRAAIQEDV